MEKNIIFQVPATITKLETKSHGSWRLQVDTQENIKPDDIAKLSELKSDTGTTKVGWFTFVRRENDGKIKPEDIIDLPILEEIDVKQKTSSQRLHDVLFVLFTKTGGDKKDFETWRLRKMDQIIEHYRSKIPQD